MQATNYSALPFLPASASREILLARSVQARTLMVSKYLPSILSLAVLSEYVNTATIGKI